MAKTINVLCGRCELVHRDTVRVRTVSAKWPPGSTGFLQAGSAPSAADHGVELRVMDRSGQLVSGGSLSCGLESQQHHANRLRSRRLDRDSGLQAEMATRSFIRNDRGDLSYEASAALEGDVAP
jgi:hypothetical protein